MYLFYCAPYLFMYLFYCPPFYKFSFPPVFLPTLLQLTRLFLVTFIPPFSCSALFVVFGFCSASSQVSFFDLVTKSFTTKRLSISFSGLQPETLGRKHSRLQEYYKPSSTSVLPPAIFVLYICDKFCTSKAVIALSV